MCPFVSGLAEHLLHEALPNGEPEAQGFVHGETFVVRIRSLGGVELSMLIRVFQLVAEP